jgi:type I restriction enzyme S subunit
VKRLNDELKKKIDMINRGEVPKGYKKTKVGIIPEDWEVKKLGELGEFFRGKGIAKSQKRDEGIGCITYGEIYTNYNFIVKKFKSYIDKKAAQNSTAIKKNDILFAGSGETLEEIGKCIAYLGEEEAYAGGDIIIFRPYDIDGEVLGYLLNYDIVNRQKYKLGQGYSVVHIYAKELETLLIPNFRKSEQEKIAQILSTWNKAIELKEKLIEEKKKQKRGLMQKISTGKIRLPGFNGEWKKVKLKNTGVIVTGTTPSTKIKEYYENGVYPWVTPTDITEKKYISKTERYLTYKGLKVGRFLPAGSLLVTCIASIGKNAILTTDGSCNQQINAILPSKNHSNEFLYYLISYRVDYIKSYAGTSATQIINKSTFENLKFFIPSLPEQKAIAKVLSTADREIDLLTQELEQLKLQKKGLMQLLLTGIVRV